MTFAIVSQCGYYICIKVKLICGKYLVIFTKTSDGYVAVCPDFPSLRITGSTLEETERIIDESISSHIRRTDSFTVDRSAYIRANKLWTDVIEPAVNEIERKASRIGWEISTFENKSGFNQINRFNRSCSIRTVRDDQTTRKLTIGWRAGSAAFSYGNSLAVTGWKEVPHSLISFDSLVEDLTVRLLG